MNRKKKIIVSSILIISILFIAVGSYFSSYYPAKQEIINSYVFSSSTNVNQTSLGYEIKDRDNTHAIVFYPGAKVDTKAYIPLSIKLCEEGFDVFLIEMPFHFAIFSPNAMDKVLEIEKDNYDNWYIAGHSLGGAMASIYAKDHMEQLSGIIYFAAYSSKDLTEAEFPVLSIYGSNDQVLNQDAYQKNAINNPSTFYEFIIEGGNHAQFGCYGKQKGDGVSTISFDEQIRESVDFLKQILLK